MTLHMTGRRLVHGLLIVVIAALTLTVVTQAAQTITTPNAATVTYALASGGVTGGITPVAGRATLVMGVNTTLGNRGVGQVSLLRVSASFLEWVGLESTAGAAITQGFSASVGTHILFIDFSHQVDIEVNSADSFRIHNTSAAAQTGVVTMIW